MKIEYHKKFIKKFVKLPVKIQLKFYERLSLFETNISAPILNDHFVGHIYPHWRSINVTGNYRALYENIDTDIVIFMRIGTHSELYK